MPTNQTLIQRYRTAIHRTELSRPVKSAFRDGLIDSTQSVFDFGCGLGADVELLSARGILCEGWDPVFRPHREKKPADVVNLGYVVNVIESREERTQVLRQAWQLCHRLLIVSAQVLLAGRGEAQVEFGDGILTKRGTFQKYYEQGELRAYKGDVLGQQAYPAGLGIFYVFKDASLAQEYLAKRYRRRAATPRKRLSEVQFEANRELLESFMTTVAALGRLPEEDEFPEAAALKEGFGSIKRAFALVKRVSGTSEWDEITTRCTEDLLVYLALAVYMLGGHHFGRPVGTTSAVAA